MPNLRSSFKASSSAPLYPCRIARHLVFWIRSVISGIGNRQYASDLKSLRNDRSDLRDNLFWFGSLAHVLTPYLSQTNFKFQTTFGEADQKSNVSLIGPCYMSAVGVIAWVIGRTVSQSSS